MANQSFDYGLFGDGNSAPSDYGTNFRPVGGPMEAAMAEMQYAGSGAIRGNPFDRLTGMVTNKRRMDAVKEARANGLTPDMGDQYYGYIRDRLTDFGDMQGAEMVEMKRMQAIQLKTESDYKKAQTEGTLLDNVGKRQEINSNAPERKLRVLEAGVDQNERQIGQKDRQLDLEVRKQDWDEETWESPNDKFEKDKSLLKMKYGFDLDLENIRTDRAIKEATIKRGMQLGKPLTTQEAKMGSANFVTHLTQLQASDQEQDKQKLKRIEDSLGMSIDDILSKAGGTDAEAMQARALLASQGAIVASNYRDLKNVYPNADEGQLWRESTSMPTDARLIQVDGQYYWYLADTKEAFKVNVK